MFEQVGEEKHLNFTKCTECGAPTTHTEDRLWRSEDTREMMNEVELRGYDVDLFAYRSLCPGCAIDKFVADVTPDLDDFVGHYGPKVWRAGGEFGAIGWMANPAVRLRAQAAIHGWAPDELRAILSKGATISFIDLVMDDLTIDFGDSYRQDVIKEFTELLAFLPDEKEELSPFDSPFELFEWFHFYMEQAGRSSFVFKSTVDEMRSAGMRVQARLAKKWYGLSATKILELVDAGVSDDGLINEARLGIAPEQVEMFRALLVSNFEDLEALRLVQAGLTIEMAQTLDDLDLWSELLEFLERVADTTVDQFMQWMEFDQQGPNAFMAIDWRLAGFDPSGAREWADEQFSPEDAAKWAAAGVSVETASRRRSAGIRPT